jgi:hypothetical protein
MSNTEATQAPKASSDFCEKHKTPMIKEREHIGSGNWQWSVPYCPLCRELEAKAAAQPSAG